MAPNQERPRPIGKRRPERLADERQEKGDFNVWLRDRRAGYARDVLVEFAKALPATVKWIAWAVIAGGAAGQAAMVMLVRSGA